MIRGLLSFAVAFAGVLIGIAPKCSAGNDNYCGVYCVYAALDVYDRDVAFESLLEPEYVSGYGGSTNADLCRALDDHGLYGSVVGGIGIAGLKLASTPIILHVRRSQGTQAYDHWVLYLGETENGRARLADPYGGERILTYAELLALGDGSGVVVSRNHWQALAYLGILNGFRLCLLLSLVGLTSTFVVLLRRVPRIGPTPAWCGGILASVFLFAWLQPASPIRHAIPAASIASVHAKPQFGTISADELYARLEAKNDQPRPLLVDARFSRDYHHGHLPGAVNFPINRRFEDARRFERKFKEAPSVVVYCQSAGCPFSDAVATRLSSRVDKPFFIFRGGYVQWKEAGHPIVRTATPGSEPALAEDSKR